MKAFRQAAKTHVPDSTNVWRQSVPRWGPSVWEGMLTESRP